MAIHLNGTVKSIYNEFRPHVDAVSFKIWSDQQESWWPAEWDAMEIAHDAHMEERAIYHGMTEEEFMNLPDWRFR